MLYEDDYEESEQKEILDNSQVNKLFELLEEDGILAKQNFMCCSNCAGSNLYQKAQEATQEIKGIVFYHEQDAGRALDCGKLYLSFSNFDKNPNSFTMEEIANKIVNHCKTVGLKTNWNGNPSERVELILNWWSS